MVELLAKNACEPTLKARYLCLSRCLFPGGRGLHDSVQAGLKLDCQALRIEEIAGLDQIASTLPLARAVFRACRHLGTHQACGSLPRRDWPDLKWRSDIDHRRGSKARARGAPVQSHSGQVDEDPGIRLGLHQIPPSQSMDRSHGGLANHTVIEQGRA